MKPNTSIRAVIALAATAALALSACGGSDPLAQKTTPAASQSGGTSTGAVTVGSANFPESALLAEIYAQALEGKGIKVTRKFNIGNRERYLAAMTNGEIDVLPEYTGSLLNYYDKSASPKDGEEAYTLLKVKIPGEFVLLDKSAAEDKNSIVVTKATADAWGLKSIADLSAHNAELSIAAPTEFKTRQQGLVGLKSVYNVVPADFRPLDSQASTVEALKNGQVKAANIFSTDPSIVANGFVVLDDPKSLFGSDNVVPLVLKAKDNPTLDSTLNAVSAKLDTPTLARLVKEVVVDHKDGSVVAKEFLTAAGLQ